MRVERTINESRIVERLGTPLAHLGILNPEISEDIIDSPDIVVKHDAGLLGIEVARLDYEKYCKWLASAGWFCTTMFLNFRKLPIAAIQTENGSRGLHATSYRISHAHLIGCFFS